jgi:mycothiol synthase
VADLPAGVSVGPLDVRDDGHLAAAFEVRRAYELAVVGTSELTADSVRATMTSPDAWLTEHRLACRGEEAVGVLIVEMDRRGREVFADAHALGPDASVVQRVLLEGVLAATSEVARQDPDTRVPRNPFLLSPDVWQVVSGCYAEDAAYAVLMGEMGFEPIRRFWRMHLDAGSRSPVEPAAPAGVTRRVVDGERDRRTMHRLFTESFAEHFGSTHDHPYDEWMARVEALDGVDPSRWWIASLDGQDVGICLLDDSRIGSGDAYVRTLGVVDSARGRGIARWLLECAAADTVRRGHAGMSLAVDGENTTGATALYTSVGFTVQRTIDVFCHPIVPGRT